MNAQASSLAPEAQDSNEFGEASRGKLPVGDLLVVAGALGFAFKGIFARIVFAQGTSVTGVVTFRVLVAVPFFWLGMAFARRHGHRLPDRKTALRIAPAGALFLTAALLDFMAVERIGAALSRVILFTYPAFVMVMDAGIKRTRPPASAVIAFICAWTGLALIAIPAGGVEFDTVGAALSTGCALIYAVFVITTQQTAKIIGAPAFTTVANTGAALALLLLLPLYTRAAGPVEVASASIPAMVALVVFCTVLPFFCMSAGIRVVGATRASLIALIGPPVTVAAAAILLGEALTVRQWIGSIIIFSAVAASKLVKPRVAGARA